MVNSFKKSARTRLWDLLTMRTPVDINFTVNNFNMSLEKVFIRCDMVTNAAHITKLFLNELRKLFHIFRHSSTVVEKRHHNT